MPTVSQKGDIDPPDQVTSEAVRGFLTGAFRVSLIIIILVIAS